MESYVPFVHQLMEIALFYKRTGEIPTFRKRDGRISRRVCQQITFEPVKCCGSIFRYPSHLERHKTHCKLTKTGVKCHMCKEILGSTEALEIHRSEVHHFSGNRWHCMLCNKSFITNGILTTHLATVHIKATSYECNRCQFSSYKKCVLKRHVKTVHEGVRSFKCDTCGLMFVRKSYLTQHVAVHLKGRFNCVRCNITFESIERLETHQAVHRPCQLCGLTFRLQKSRDSHMNWHLTGSKTYRPKPIRKPAKSDIKDQGQNVRMSLKEIQQNS